MGYAYLIPIVDGFREHIEKYYENPIESEKEISKKIPANTYNLVIINLKTLAKIIDEIRENKNDIYIVCDSINSSFISVIIEHYVKKCNFKNQIYLNTI